MNNGSSYTTQNVNTPSILTSAGVVLSANTARIGWTIVNLSTNTLYVAMGSTASTSVFHVVLKASTATDDGLGGSVGQEQGVIYTGAISVAGTAVRCVVTEFAP